jgi:hypothetical protein
LLYEVTPKILGFFVNNSSNLYPAHKGLRLENS